MFVSVKHTQGIQFILIFLNNINKIKKNGAKIRRLTLPLDFIYIGSTINGVLGKYRGESACAN